MTPQEKIYNEIRDWFILTDRDFLKLSAEKQQESILSMIRLYVDNLKNKE